MNDWPLSDLFVPDLLIDRRVLMHFLHVLPYVTCTPTEKVDRPLDSLHFAHSFDARLRDAMQQALLAEWLKAPVSLGRYVSLRTASTEPQQGHRVRDGSHTLFSNFYA
jgi:hypothetical protein